MTYTRKISKKLVCFILAAVLLCETHVLDAAKADVYPYYYFSHWFYYNSSLSSDCWILTKNVTARANGNNKAYAKSTSFSVTGTNNGTNLTVVSISTSHPTYACHLTYAGDIESMTYIGSNPAEGAYVIFIGTLASYAHASTVHVEAGVKG